ANQGWCWFKVPGLWPSNATEGAQRVWMSDWAEDKLDLSKYDQAWYKRELTTPDNWRGKRLWLNLTMLQTAGRVYVDGKLAGELWFPGGRLDLTNALQPGTKQELAILVTARPTDSESRNFMAPDRVVATKSSVDLRGLTGDVFLEAEPTGPRIGDVHVITSVKNKRITLDTALPELANGQYRLLATVLDGGKVAKSFQSAVFSAAEVKDGRFSFGSEWNNPKLWDTDTPQNMYSAVVRLQSGDGKLLDEALPERFGFREFSLVGRDFVLNGKPIHLRALLVQNLNQPADVASLAASKETCRRLRQYGFNFFITGNYHFRPGAVGYMAGMLQAADETGMLWAFSLPHLTDFKIDPAKPETLAAYRALSEYLIRRVQNHPGVIMYAMNHNATGYYGDQNPLKIDGLYNPEGAVGKNASWSSRNREIAPLTAAVAKSLDPTRPVYHHQSGNLGDMHTVNIYLNWAPKQERSDWLEHWATEGTKPVFFVEWGLPHISSWSSYRGPEFIWTTSHLQSVWDSEYAADYVGQQAYRMTPTKVKSLQHEEELWAKGQPFPWGDVNRFLGQQEENYLQVQSLMAADNWRSHRTWGLSAGLPWDQGGLWRRDPQAAPEKGMAVENALTGLQQPGIVPDRLLPHGDFLTTTTPEAQQPTSLGRTFLRWNMPLCAYLGGGPTRFTDKAHNFRAGETVRKQLVLLNDTRRDTKCQWSWRMDNGKATTGTASVPAGGKTFVPVLVKLPATIATGPHTLSAKFTFADGTVQEDALKLDVLPVPDPTIPDTIA
ncbi:MAG: glycoside hydrolase family 2 TIM barrel-domain containing protein, partial [Armatimonadota bacterium]